MVRPAWLIHTAFALKLSHAEQVDAGLHSWVDAVGNVHGTVEVLPCSSRVSTPIMSLTPGLCQGENPCGGALVLGSHYDTVLDAGKYDGALGVIAAIGAVKAFLQTKRTPACPVRHAPACAVAPGSVALTTSRAGGGGGLQRRGRRPFPVHVPWQSRVRRDADARDAGHHRCGWHNTGPGTCRFPVLVVPHTRLASRCATVAGAG